MAGLMTPQMRGEGGEGGEQGEAYSTAEGGEMGEGGERGETESNVTPEEQAQYDDFMNKAFQVAYDAKFFPQLLDRIAKATSPQEGLAAVTVAVVKRIADTAEQDRQPYSGDVLFAAGTELLEDLADTAQKAGIHDYSEQELEGALYRAMDLYREQSGDLSQDPNIQADFGQLVEADRAGRLDEIAPGLSQKFGSGQSQRPQARGMLNGGM